MDGAYYKSSAVDDDYYDSSESVTIGDAAGGSFYFYVTHAFNYYEAETLRTADHMAAGTLSIVINGVEYGEKWMHDVDNGIHTHTNSEDINKDYDELLIVLMTCDKDCACTFEKIE